MRIASLRSARWLLLIGSILCAPSVVARAEGPPKEKDKSSAKKGGSKDKEKGKAKEVDAHYDAARQAVDSDDFVKCVEELNASLAARPSPKAALLLGDCHLKMGQFEEAKSAFGMVLQLDKKSTKKGEVQRILKMIDSIASAKFKIDTVPEGATIFVDLKAAGPRGKTPLEISVLPGRHRIIATLEGFDDGLATPDPVANSGKTSEVVVTLRQKGCDVSLSSKTPDVMANVDGGESIALPAQVRVIPGLHKVVFSGHQRVPKAAPIDCKDYQPIALVESLDMAPGGVLAIQAQGGWQIFVDGEPVQPTDAGKMVVRPGEHAVEVQEAGKTPWHAVVTVRSGEQTDVRPQPQVGQLGTTGVTITPDPSTAMCFLDNKALTCNQLTAIRPGKHRIEARARGYKPFLKEITLEPGQVVDVKARPEHRSWAPLVLAIVATGGAATAEAIAIYDHVKANGQVGGAGSTQYQRYANTETAMHITAGSLAAAAVVFYGVHFGIQARKGLEGSKETTPRLSGFVTPNSGALMLTGSF